MLASFSALKHSSFELCYLLEKRNFLLTVLPSSPFFTFCFHLYLCTFVPFELCTLLPSYYVYFLK